jgi:MarR-like DNA-binding transcriptional regulator SgrR of sgrS sRNA
MKKITASRNLVNQYHRLRLYFDDQNEVLTTVDELADALCCTRRNVNLVLQKMTLQEWLLWFPSRGRGKRSRLTLLAKDSQLTVQLAIQTANNGYLEDAFDLLNSGSEKAALFDYLKTQLGFQGSKNQTLRIPYRRSINDLNPATASRMTEIHMIRQVMDCLIHFDSSQQEMLPHLAHSWRKDISATQWTFFLRPGISFHHGRPLVADDVKATLEHLRDFNGPYKFLYRHIQHIHCPTAFTIEITLAHRDHLFLHLLSKHTSVIQPADLMYKHGFYKQPIGTGPFKVGSRNAFHLELVANDQYFKERPLLDRVEILLFTDEAAALDDASDMYFTPISHQQHGNMQHNSKVEAGYQYLLFNVENTNSPVQNLPIRRCIRSIVDGQAMVDELGGKRKSAAQRMLPEWENDTQRLMFQVRPRMPMYIERPLKLYTYSSHIVDAQWIKKTLASFGIAVAITVLEFELFVDTNNWLDADLVLSGEVLDDNLEMALYGWFATQPSLQHCMGKDQRNIISKKLDQALALAKKELRMEAFRDMDIHLQQELILLPLYHHQHQMHHAERVQGHQLNCLGWVNFKDIWFDDGCSDH